MVDELVAAILALLVALGVPVADSSHEPRDRPIGSAAERQSVAQPSELEWRQLRRCESRNRYRIDTGNGYFGAYQFDLTTWRGVGGSGYPHEASPSEQDARARKLYALRGSDPWPVCGRFLEE